MHGVMWTISTGEVRISDLLLHLLHLMLTLSSQRSSSQAPPSSGSPQSAVDAEDFNPVHVITHVFEEIIAGNTLGQQLFCNVSW